MAVHSFIYTFGGERSIQKFPLDDNRKQGQAGIEFFAVGDKYQLFFFMNFDPLFMSTGTLIFSVPIPPARTSFGLFTRFGTDGRQ
jgi:hypothetical protein